jgi:outer membrane protein TolC
MDAWLDLALAAEKERLALQSASLAAVAGDAATAALAVGSRQTALLGVRILAAKADDEVAAAAAEVAAAKATLGALAAIDSPDSMATPTRLPLPRSLPDDPAKFERAIADSPTTRELRHEKAGREAAVDLAELQWIPDINPQAAFMGSADQVIGIAVMLPTRIASIRSGVQAAKAMRSAASASLQQSRRDQLGEVRATLITAAGAARSRRLLEKRVLPDALSTATAAESAWSAGSMQLADVVEARLAVLEVRGGIAEAAVEREKQLAALEELLETLAPDAPCGVALAGAAPSTPSMRSTNLPENPR